MKAISIIPLAIAGASAINFNFFGKTWVTEEEANAVSAALAVGTPCTEQNDSCGDSMTMCCGLAAGGKVLRDSTPWAQKNLYAPNLAICNKRPGDDGRGCESYYMEWVGGNYTSTVDATRVWSYYPAAAFTCFEDLLDL